MDLHSIKTKKIDEEIVEQVKKSLSEGELLPGGRFFRNGRHKTVFIYSRNKHI